MNHVKIGKSMITDIISRLWDGMWMYKAYSERRVTF